jgi:hypothetical protein
MATKTAKRTPKPAPRPVPPAPRVFGAGIPPARAGAVTPAALPPRPVFGAGVNPAVAGVVTPAQAAAVRTAVANRPAPAWVVPKNPPVPTNGTVAQMGTAQAQLTRLEENAPDVSAYTTLVDTLESYGFTPEQLVGPNGMATVAWDQMKAGVPAEQISLNIQQMPQFKAMFPEIDQRIARGLPPITVAQVISTKDSYTQALVAAGINPSTVNMNALIANDVSPAELSDRIQQGYLAVAMAPQDVVSAFHNYYGVTRGELASYFLNPAANEASLLRKAAAAQIGGAAAGSGFMGATQGSGKFPVNQQLANQLAAQGVTYQQAQTGFAQLAQQAQLYNRLPGQQMPRQFSVPQLAEAQFFGGPVEQQLQLNAAAEEAYFKQGTQLGTSGSQTAAGPYQR